MIAYPEFFAPPVPDRDVPRNGRLPKLPISAIIPVCGNERTIAAVVERTIAALRKYSGDFEVILVDNASAGGTPDLLELLRLRFHPHLRIVALPERDGYGFALRSGFYAARKRFLLCLDPEGQYDVAELPRLIRLMLPDVGLVNGYRRYRHDPWQRMVLADLQNAIARTLFGVTIRDPDCGFRLIRQEALQVANPRATGWTIGVELASSIQMTPWRTVETEVIHFRQLFPSGQPLGVLSICRTLVQFAPLYWRLLVQPKIQRGARVAQRVRS